MRQCRQVGATLPLRYVPPGDVGEPPPGAGTSASLVFFGSIDVAGRRRCYEKLAAALGPTLAHTYGVWNDTALARLLGMHDVFLNLHKDCRGDGRADTTSSAHVGLEAFRLSLLLGAGKLVISARASVDDEHEWAGMITFARIADIPERYRELVRGGLASYRGRQTSSLALFRERFAPRRLFERAGVYQAWGLRLRRDADTELH